ncbi:MAG: hypothetical protein KIT11_06935 [Fimbriimonadaceae bacterium]|nr:hypothetical protein [Fimbriimonadaceae bacterium]QYK56087.1 MAG: hypothetical protein KF733_01125 [Fimbriimonadaceae bacterium]
MRDTFIAALTAAAEQDDRIMLITGDLGFGVLTKFAEERPRQFLNAGVAEQNMTMLAAGLALEGRVVFTYSIANFPILRCLEMIRNDAAYHEANVKVVSIGGGFSYGSLGMSHHATEDLAIMRALPGVTVVAPCTLHETAAATKAIVAAPGTCYLRLDKSAAPEPAAAPAFELGKARVFREGADLTLVTCGGIMEEVLVAAETLAGQGVQCRVLSLHTLVPIDREALVRAARETGGVVTVEEHGLAGGLGGAVAEVLLDEGCSPRAFGRVALRAGYSSVVGSQTYLRKYYQMDAEAIVAAARHALARGKREAASV